MMKSEYALSILTSMLLFLNVEAADSEPHFHYSRNGIRIHSLEIDPPGKFDPKAPRSKTTIDSKKALEISDQFLTDVYGVEFMPDVAAVALFRKYSTKSKKYYWVWQISYIDPDKRIDERSSVLITVIVSIDGKLLMKKS